VEDELEKHSQKDDASSQETREIGFVEAVWRLFSSMKTAIALLLLLALASIVGTLIPQGSPPQMYVQRYGEAKYALFRSLGFTDLYHSSWYTLLLALVSANLFVCSINRFKLAWARTWHPKVAVRPGQVSGMQVSDRFNNCGSVEAATDKAITALKAGSYKVIRERNGDAECLYAAKGRFGIWGPYITHLSILIIFAGAVFGNRLGFEGFTTITEGKQTTTYYPRGSHGQEALGFEVRLREFSIEYDADHNPTAYKSDLQVYDNSKLVAQKVIDVNHPLTYKGVSFFQSDYGVVGMVLRVTGPDGTTTRIPIDIQTQDLQNGKQYIPELAPVHFETGDQTWSLFVHNFAPDYVGPPQINDTFMPINPAAQVYVNEDFPKEKTAWNPVGWVTLKEPAEYKGHKIELEKVIDYTGLQVARNPALPVIYVGFALMLIGVFVAFYVPHRMIRASISGAGDGANVVVGAMCRTDPSIFGRDFDRLRKALG